MIEQIEGLPDGVIGFEAKGKVTSEDYEDVLMPAVEAALAEHEKMSLLYLLGDEFEAYTGMAMWKDTKVGMQHPFAWRRIALVTDNDAYRHMIKAAGFLTPAHIKTFELAELEDAKEWLAAED